MIYDCVNGDLRPSATLSRERVQIAVVTADHFPDAAALCPDPLSDLDLPQFFRHAQATHSPECAYGSLRSLAMGKESEDAVFFLILKTHVVLVVRDESMRIRCDAFFARARQGASPHRLAVQFFLELFQRDVRALEETERLIGRLEDAALEEIPAADARDPFERRLARILRRIRELHFRCERAQDVADLLMENAYGVFPEESLPFLRQLSDCLSRLTGGTRALRDYALQVRDMRQSRIAARQNRIMQTLTVVTTIFLPLSLIVGWYGMNFANMPELHSPYAYPAVVVLCALVALGCIWYFKRKKFM